MATERFGKGELKGGGWRFGVRAPPQAVVAMTTPTVLGRGRPGGVTNGRVGAGRGWQLCGAGEGGES